MTDREKIIDKVAKIKAHAESAAKIGNAEEAQAFAEMMQRLLLRHKLSLTDVEYATLEQEEPVSQHPIQYSKYPDVNLRNKRVAWMEDLALIVAKAHFCRILVHHRSNRLTLIGRRSDAEVAEYMIITLQRLLSKISYDEAHRHRLRCRATGQHYEPLYRKSFIHGFVSRLASRYHEERRRTEAGSSDGTALVRLNQAEIAVSKYMERYTRRAPTLGLSQGMSEAGYKRGKDVADSIQLRANAVKGPESRPKALRG